MKTIRKFLKLCSTWYHCGLAMDDNEACRNCHSLPPTKDSDE